VRLLQAKEHIPLVVIALTRTRILSIPSVVKIRRDQKAQRIAQLSARGAIVPTTTYRSTPMVLHCQGVPWSPPMIARFTVVMVIDPMRAHLTLAVNYYRGEQLTQTIVPIAAAAAIGRITNQ